MSPRRNRPRLAANPPTRRCAETTRFTASGLTRLGGRSVMETRLGQESTTSVPDASEAHLVSPCQVADLLPDPVIATWASRWLADVFQGPQLLRLGR
jgi:hypothetical protein